MSEINTPLNEWATAGTKTEPTAPKRAEGWLLEEKPAFENFNWQWAEWVDRFNYIYKNPSAGYNAATNYNGAGQQVRASDSMLYVSVQSNGPTTTVQDPTTDVGDVFWELLSSHLNLGTAAAANLGTGVGNVPVYAAGQFLTGNVNGSATRWQNSILMSMTGEVAGSNSFDGSAGVSINCTLPNAGSMFNEDAGTTNTTFRTNLQNDGRFGIVGTSGTQVRSNTDNDARFLLESNNLSDVTVPVDAFNAIKQPATTSATGVVEKATAVELDDGTADKFPDSFEIKQLFGRVEELQLRPQDAPYNAFAGDFTTGAIGCSRIGNRVSLTGQLTFAAQANPTSLDGFIPSAFSGSIGPGLLSNISTLVEMGSGHVASAGVDDEGRFFFSIRDWAGASNATRTVVRFTLNYYYGFTL